MVRVGERHSTPFPPCRLTHPRPRLSPCAPRQTKKGGVYSIPIFASTWWRPKLGFGQVRAVYRPLTPRFIYVSHHHIIEH